MTPTRDTILAALSRLTLPDGTALTDRDLIDVSARILEEELR